MADRETGTAAPTTPTELGAAFSLLRGSLRNYLRRRINDASLIDDLIQEVFVKASLAISTQRAPRNLTGWLYAATRNTLVDHYRSVRHDSTELTDNLPDAEVDNDELLRQELATCIRPLVQQLPALYRDTLLATDFDGRTLRSLAEEQGVTLSAIKSRASRGRHMLKERLLECCEVEIDNGRVSDYRLRTAASNCGGGCG